MDDFGFSYDNLFTYMIEEHDIKLHERLTSVETNLQTILDNHLPHLQAQLDNLSEKLWWVLGTIILGFLTTLVMLYVK